LGRSFDFRKLMAFARKLECRKERIQTDDIYHSNPKKTGGREEEGSKTCIGVLSARKDSVGVGGCKLSRHERVAKARGSIRRGQREKLGRQFQYSGGYLSDVRIFKRAVGGKSLGVE